LGGQAGRAAHPFLDRLRIQREDATGPLSVYGETKLAGENEVRAAGGNFLILRTSWVYAAIGTNFLRTMTRLGRERTQLRIVADQIGAPTSAALIADAVTSLVGEGLDSLRQRAARARGVVHLAASGETSWHGFAVAIFEGLRQRGVVLAVEDVVPIRSEDYPTRASRPLNSRLDLGRLKSVFGIEPAHWRDPLAIELEALLRQPD
jgi:dTDP-4-dehydrorhamnose reductase